MASLGDLMLRLGVDLSAFNASMGEVGPRVQQAARDAEREWAPMATLGTSMMGIGAGLTAALTVPIAGLGAAAIKTGEQLNLATMAFTTMLGSGEKAQALLAQLKAFAASTPFEFPDLVEASKRMLAMGFTAEQLIPTMRTIGDAVAALGGGKDVINGVTLALGQMQAKGKVSAQEMNQLAERGIPAWKFLADQIGVSIPEAMKMAETGALKSAEAIPAILAGMNAKFGGSMVQMSGTLTGVWSNFKDSITMTLAELGTTLTPVLTQLVQAALPLLEWAKGAAQWFAALPEPVRNGALAFGAMLAVAGPLLLAVGGVTAAIGTLMPLLAPIGVAVGIGTTAMLGWAAAIPLAVAALVALGTWVYDNWDAIKAVVFTAWEGIQEAWSGVWTPIISTITGFWSGIANAAEPIFGPLRTFFGAIWNGIETVFSTAWNNIKGALTTVWSAIQTAASTVWGGIVSTFQTFLEWAAKIPGVNKLMNLDDAWTSAKKMEAETSKAAAATKKLKDEASKAAGGASKPLPKLSASIAKVGTEASGAATHAGRLIDKQTELTATAKLLTDQHDKAEKNVAALKEKLRQLGDTVPDVKLASDEFNKTLGDMIAKSLDLSNTKIPGITSSMTSLKGSTLDLNGALATLGVKSQTEYQKVADEAKKAYDVVAGSGVATPTEQNNAMLAMMKAQVDAMTAAGQSIPAEMQATIDRLETTAKAPNGMPKVEAVFTSFGSQVKTVVGTLGTDLNGLLFSGDKSWAEKGKAALGLLKNAFDDLFIKPVTTAIGDLMSGVLSDLIGGKGFGGVVDSVKAAGQAIAGVFGKGGGAVAGGAGSAAGSVGGVGGSAGSAGGAAASSTAALVGAAASVGTLISSVIGNFQNAHQETSLNAIEHNTRYSMMYLGEREDGGILGTLFRVAESLQYAPAQLDGLNLKLSDWLEPTKTAVQAMASGMSLALTRLDQIGNDVMWGSASEKAAETILNDIRTDVRRGSGMVNNFYVTGSNPQQIADTIALRLRTQGAIA